MLLVTFTKIYNNIRSFDDPLLRILNLLGIFKFMLEHEKLFPVANCACILNVHMVTSRLYKEDVG